MIYVEDRHTIDRRPLGIASSGVEHVVSTDDDDRVGIGKLIVDRLHLVETIVVHISLGKEYVHVSRHTTSHRVDRILNISAALGELIGQLLDLLLCLR